MMAPSPSAAGQFPLTWQCSGVGWVDRREGRLLRDRAPMKMTTFTAALFAVLALEGTAQAEPADGLIGQPLAVAQTREFFTWFHLAQTASQPCGGGQALGFRPDGEQFHQVVAVEVMTDAHDDIATMALMLDRAFIDDSANGVLARDIAKSFLRDVPGSQAGAGVAALADEIKASMLSSGTVVFHSDVSPTKPKGPPSPGYQVFLGDRESYVLTIGGEALTLINEQQQGEATLRLSFSKDGAAPACALGKVAD